MQKDFDVKWCRGRVKEKIFQPWIDSMKTHGCEFLSDKRVTDFCLDEETGHISGVICGRETYNTDAVIMAVRISTLQDIVRSRSLSFLLYLYKVLLHSFVAKLGVGLAKLLIFFSSNQLQWKNTLSHIKPGLAHRKELE